MVNKKEDTSKFTTLSKKSIDDELNDVLGEMGDDDDANDRIVTKLANRLKRMDKNLHKNIADELKKSREEAERKKKEEEERNGKKDREDKPDDKYDKLLAKLEALEKANEERDKKASRAATIEAVRKGLKDKFDKAKLELNDFFLDTAISKLEIPDKDADVTENVIYELLLADRLPVNLGAVYENVVAQELVASGNGLFYHTWSKEDANRNYEIDFILPRGKKICPVEVKSSGYKTHASLNAFLEKYPSRVGTAYLVYTKDLRKDSAITCMPTYMTRFI